MNRSRLGPSASHERVNKTNEWINECMNEMMNVPISEIGNGYVSEMVHV